MMNRNKPGGRRAGKRARLAVAAALLAGGSAAGVVALTASRDAAATTQSAKYGMGHHQAISETKALTAAFSGWDRSQSRSLAVLSMMRSMRTFSQVREHHVMLAAQRGIVVLATRKFLVVRSANGSLHLWWLTRGTRFKNVATTTAGMVAMTGSSVATSAAMTRGDMTPATTLMAGSTQLVNQMTAPMPAPATFTINSGGQVITITIARSTATVTQSTTLTAQTTMATQPAFLTTNGIARGDLALAAGVRRHGALFAKIVLFTAPATTATPSATPSVTVMPTTAPTATMTPGTTTPGTMATATATATTTGTATSTAITGAPAFSGSHS